MPTDRIAIRGAREHNLRNIDVDIPRDRLVVVTGLSGSGKSSLAFDTIYAEGQRRYVESLSAYARQFLEQMGKPDVDSIEGLSPAISIEQKGTSRSPRSTVGTVTEIYDYLRLLYARVGRPFCYQCGKPIEAQTVQSMADRILEHDEGTRFSLLSPVVRGRKGEYKKELAQLRKDGYVRVRVDGEVLELAEPIDLCRKRKHDIDVFVDRLVVRPNIRGRLVDSLETALELSAGIVKVLLHPDGPELLMSERHACTDCGISYPELAPRSFSFNAPQGACPGCSGLGAQSYVDPELVVPDGGLSVLEGAIAPWARTSTTYMVAALKQLCEHYGADPGLPFAKLPEAVRHAILHGTEKGEKLRMVFEREGMRHEVKREFEGVCTNLWRRYHETQSEQMRAEIEAYMSSRPCPECNGARLRKEALHVLVGGRNIAGATSLSIREADRFFATLELTPREEEIGRRILKEIRDRLGFLVNVGLQYVTLDRQAGSLSGGEAQRIRLATQIGSALMGVLYILDEPSIGLHQRDNARLLDTLRHLRDVGNTVLVVEHDEETMRAADHVIDLGPGAGVHGGQVVCAGSPADVESCEGSLTGAYLSGRMRIPTPARRRAGNGACLRIRGARHNNLRGIDVEVPLGKLVCVTGVSGSGKSSLVVDTLHPYLTAALYRARTTCGDVDAIEGIEHVDQVIDIDQSPIGRTPRSNPVTYTDAFGPIRSLFSQLPDARIRGYTPGRFSFNVKGGRCEACQGAGIIRIEMHFLPDVFVRCDECKGRRFNRETLDVRYKGRSIAEVLEMTVDEALAFFEAIPAVRRKLQTLSDVGMGYVHLGQAATTLSGGEAQRVKLAKELSKRSTGRTIYILDEPTTGLHFDDVRKLLEVLERLADEGNTVVVIEHNLDVVKTADHVIDMGPEGGDGGGLVVASGTPEEIARCEQSHTGHYLRKVL